MKLSSEEKRKNYFKNNPLVYQLYQEIKQENAAGGALQADKLWAIKEYAILHTDFYKSFSTGDEFPVMTKLDYIEHYNEIRSKEQFDKPIHRTSTSGSTGIPFVVEQNFEKRQRVIAELKVFGDYAGYLSHEKMIQLRAYNGVELDRKKDEEENIYRYDICDLSDTAIERLLAWVEEWQPKIIFGYTSTLESICDYIAKSDRTYVFPQLHSILVGAEILTKEAAEKISAAFHCPIYDRYSNMEMGILAQREFGKTNFQINKSSYYFEVLKLDCDEPADAGELGRLVFTDLYNHAFPMIRYDTGDLGKYSIKNGEIEIAEVHGRKVDTVYSADGEMLSPHSVTNKMWGIKNVLQWQFIQVDTGKYLLKICRSGETDEADILQRLQAVLGDRARIDIQYVADIPVSNSQKRRYILNQMRKN